MQAPLRRPPHVTALPPPPLPPHSFCCFQPPPSPGLYTLSLHDALPISADSAFGWRQAAVGGIVFGPARLPLRSAAGELRLREPVAERSEEHTSELQSRGHLVCRLLLEKKKQQEDGGAGPAQYAGAPPPAAACDRAPAPSAPSPFLLLFSAAALPRALHSFPTRRSSDLCRQRVRLAPGRRGRDRVRAGAPAAAQRRRRAEIARAGCGKIGRAHV